MSFLVPALVLINERDDIQPIKVILSSLPCMYGWLVKLITVFFFLKTWFTVSRVKLSCLIKRSDFRSFFVFVVKSKTSYRVRYRLWFLSVSLKIIRQFWKNISYDSPTRLVKKSSSIRQKKEITPFYEAWESFQKGMLFGITTGCNLTSDFGFHLVSSRRLST